MAANHASEEEMEIDPENSNVDTSSCNNVEKDECCLTEEKIDNKQLAETKKDAGNKAYSAKDYKLAVKLYTEAIELDNCCAPYYGNRSAAYLMMKDYYHALDDAKIALKLDENYIKAYFRIARCNLAQGSTESAERALAKAKEIDPNSKTLQDEYLRVHQIQQFEASSFEAHDKEDYRKVIFCTRRLIELSPDCNLYKIMRAEALALMKKYSEAEVEANSVLRENNRNADALYVRGLCLYYQDNEEQAFKCFTNVLKIDPDHKKAKAIRKKAKLLQATKDNGNNAYKRGNFEEAYSIYTNALTIDPNNVSTSAKLYYNRAVVASKLNKMTEAIDDCTEAIKLDGSYLKAYMKRAKCYMESENYEEAVRDYEKVCKMNGCRENRSLLQDAKLQLKKSKRKDYYKILSLPKDCSDADIKKAYRREALKHHPDRHSGATDQVKKQEEMLFKEVNEAYGVLSDPQKKGRYDRGEDIDDNGFTTSDFDPNTIFQAVFGGGGFPSGFGGGFPSGFGGGHHGHEFHFTFG
ncbi:dnaJ homolog subfamily C member 7-like [Xenia sp. Carnegie-2017]|uniref:dnaJ homolog subfamily C member 7-like n=1 Tax=Xenia sp. Carnegie-2017 TaxID=2897299 RepID=UPI001F040CE6|nr:dnaJ homolog subfamily C member 7-like [Xenia sp. Carnegie-2017]